MSVWDNNDLLALVVERYAVGTPPREIVYEALSKHGVLLTRNQINSKLDRMGLLRRSGERAAKPKPRPVPRPHGAYGNMATRFSPIDPVRRALAYGPKTVCDIVEITSLESQIVSGACQRLVANGHAERVGGKGRNAVYRLIRSSKPAPLRGLALLRMEDAYVEARKAGERADDLSRRLGLTLSAAEKMESAYRAQTWAGSQHDSSCPKFADHDKHLGLVWRCKGFPAFSERAGAKGQPVASLPITFPSIPAGMERVKAILEVEGRGA